MKIHIFIPLAIVIPLLIMTLSTQGSSTLTFTVQTTKQSYDIDESIEVYGNLTYNGSPVQNTSVAFEVVNPNTDPIVTRTLQTNTYGVYGANFKLSSDAELGVYTVYVSSSYKGETATGNTTFTLAHITQTTIEIEGQPYTIITESNATITNATATKNSLHFTSSGPTGEIAYVSVALPVELNKTSIRAFIDGMEVTPPPFPIITTNGTHYLIYFEFNLSSHEITIQYAIANIAIASVDFSKTVVGQGYSMLVDVTTANQGEFTETFNVTAYANTTVIVSENVTLPAGNSSTVTFTWDTSGFGYGNYTVSAYVWPVQGETYTSDNTFTDGTVIISHVGDITGDSKCDIQDLARVSAAYGSLRVNDPSDSRYGQYWHPATCSTCPHTPNADITNDGKVDIADLARTSGNFGWHE